VTGYGGFVEGDENNDDALSVYLETVFFGLHAAKEWLLSLGKNKPSTSCAASGQHLMIRTETLTLDLRGRLGKLGDVAPNEADNKEWIIHQGEIFSGTLHIDELFEKINVNVTDFLVFSGQGRAVKVAVKVFSLAVHGCLTLPHKAWLALVAIFTARFYFDAKSMLPKFDGVLLAVHKRPNGLITIMRDLTAEGYQSLRPQDNNKDCLWRAFLDLLDDVLIPMANLDVIHPDIRPGNNETANILWKFNEESNGETAVMQIIDFESIVVFSE
jgi:hypothetical protein